MALRYLCYPVVIKRKEMKKALLIIMMILLCTGCSKEPLSNPLAENAGLFYEQEARSYISEHYSADSNYYIGTGIRTLSVDGKTVGEGKTDITPVYQDDDLMFLIIHNEKGNQIITPEKTMAYIAEHDRYVIFEMKESIYLIGEGALFSVLDDEEYEIDEDLRKLIEKECGKTFEVNMMGSKKALIKMIQPKEDPKDQPQTVANDRIVVKFKDGDREKQIAMYEEFCNGKVQSKLNSSDIYIFVFDPLNEKALNRLLEDTQALSYVESASLDRINGLNPPSAKE